MKVNNEVIQKAIDFAKEHPVAMAKLGNPEYIAATMRMQKSIQHAEELYFHSRGLATPSEKLAALYELGKMEEGED